MFKKRVKGVLSLMCCVCCILCNACGESRDSAGATYFVRAAIDSSDGHSNAIGMIYVDGHKIAENDFTDEWSYAIDGTSMEQEYPVVTVEVTAEDRRAVVSCGISVNSPDRYPVRSEGAGSVSCVFDSSRFSSYYK